VSLDKVALEGYFSLASLKSGGNAKPSEKA